MQGALHDATLNKGKRFRFTQSDRRWLEILQAFLRRLGHSSWIYREGKRRSVYALETLAPFLDFGYEPSQQARSTREKVAYLRGFFDAEGGIPRREEAKFYIQLVQKDRMKIECLKGVLADIGIDTGKIHNPSTRVDPNYWRMFVATRSHRAFVQKIGSWHPRKVELFERRMMI